MSRFFRAGSSESESEESEEEEIAPRPKAAAPTSRAFQFSDDEDETKRVVRSAKDKRFEVLQNAIKQIRNSMKINDVAKILSEYENLTKGFEKAKAVVDKEGIPNFYIKILSDLEDYIQTQWEDSDGRKKLSKLNAKALATIRQKHKKYNRDFEESIADCKANPSKYEEADDGEDEEEGESGNEVDDDEDDFRPVDSEKQRQKFDDDEESDEEAWWENEESSSSSDDDDIPVGGTRELTAAFFLKKVDAGDKEKKEKKTRVKKEPRERHKKDADEWTEIKAGGFVKTKISFPKDTEINHQVITKKFHEILAVRGKKGTDRAEQIDYFTELKRISDQHNLGPALAIKLLFSVSSAIFDSAGGTDIPLKAEMWERLLDTVKEIVGLIIVNPDIQFGDHIGEENVEDSTVPYRVQEDPVTLIERMDDEFTKILQGCDGHSTEYISKLRDELRVVALIDQLLGHLESRDFPSDFLCRIYLRRIEHMYYKLDVKELRSIRDQIKTAEEKRAAAEARDMEKALAKDTAAPSGEDAAAPSESKPLSLEERKDEQVDLEAQKERDSFVMLDRLCKFIYANAADRIRTRAMLCQIYHHALHDRWYQARDLMLISHLQETIQHSDIPTQILYNRTMVQLGLCAFRHGMIYEAHNCLHDIQATGRAKEMLSQGLMNLKNMERTPEQEKIEKRRMMPFHMHINLELLECVYLTSAMLLEIPFMASHEFDYRRRIISKSFHYQLRVSERQPLIGPPESMREHVVAASKAMKTGDWRKCNDFILAVSCWDLFPNAASVRSMITRKIQEESLRTYLFTYNKIYDSISMHSLAQMFDLPPQVVHSTISKMIINEELQASWDEPTHTLVLHHGAEPTYLQSLTLQLSDKINGLVDLHERILDFKYGRDPVRGERGGPSAQRSQGAGRGRGGGRFMGGGGRR